MCVGLFLLSLLPRSGSASSIPNMQQSPSVDKKYDIRSGVFTLCNHPHTIFRRFYERGDLPVIIRHRSKLSLEFQAAIESLDVSYYLPIFIDGLRERCQPFRFVAQEGTFQLIKRGDTSQIVACLPELIYPIKFALESCDKPTIILGLRVLQNLASASRDIAENLVPFYRQLLPALNRYKHHKRNLGDQIDFAQFKHDGRTLGETIEETLTLLDQTGGEDAFINIKYIIPTYETAL